MKTNSGAYRLLKVLFNLIDNQFQFDINVKRSLVTKNTSRVFNYLLEAGYVERIEDDNFAITERAQINFLKELVSKRSPDGMLRIVMFDIPEKIKGKRNVFRRHLADLGFKMKQQSVWASPLPCEDLVQKVVKYHQLEKCVAFVVGKELPIERTAVQ